MSFFPLVSQNAAAAIAGTDRAASVQTASTAASCGGVSVAPSGTVDPTAPVVKGDPAGDRGADGRQLLDTFERRQNQGQNPDPDGDAQVGSDGQVSELPTHSLESSPGHLDMQA
jgi:hypothetical protein